MTCGLYSWSVDFVFPWLRSWTTTKEDSREIAPTNLSKSPKRHSLCLLRRNFSSSRKNTSAGLSRRNNTARKRDTVATEETPGAVFYGLIYIFELDYVLEVIPSSQQEKILLLCIWNRCFNMKYILSWWAVVSKACWRRSGFVQIHNIITKYVTNEAVVLSFFCILSFQIDTVDSKNLTSVCAS